MSVWCPVKDWCPVQGELSRLEFPVFLGLAPDPDYDPDQDEAVTEEE